MPTTGTNERELREIRDQCAELKTLIVETNAELKATAESIELLRAGMADKFAHIESKIERTNHILTGNGEPSKGLIVRVDRLEQTDSRRVWWLRGVTLAAIAALFAWIREIATK